MLHALPNWSSITDLGDSAVGLPLAALVLIVLLVSGWTRGALAWTLAVAGCGAAMITFKLIFRVASGACAPAAQVVPAFSPSGHAALSTVVYGGLAVLGSRQVTPLARTMIGLATAVWIGLIASSRVVVQAHTPFEVVTGLGVGLVAVALMVRLLRHSEGPRMLLPHLAAACLAALVLMYGTHWQVEDDLRALASLLHRSVVCTA
jgi:membrane-associated phospholipid phosphatase